MAKELPLTLAFLNRKPLAAGRELATMGAEEAATFLDAIPTRSAAPPLAAMGAWSASAVLSRMSTTSAAAILSIVDYLDAAAILRHLSVADRKRVLSDVPEKMRRDFETSLVFPDDTVGAHMTTAVLILTKQHAVEDAVVRIRRSAMVNLDVILVVDADRNLAGVVTVSSLLRHAGNTPLGAIMDGEIESVSARSRLSAIDGLKGWDDYSALPVVSRQNHVIGVLLRKAVTHADSRRDSSGPQSTTSIAISMLDAFIASTVGMTHALVGTESPTTVQARAGSE